jgi:hypothetical protein
MGSLFFCSPAVSGPAPLIRGFAPNPCERFAFIERGRVFSFFGGCRGYARLAPDGHFGGQRR